jgi:hypothetical protein
LNMMTRTCALDLSRRGIFMTSVDTGWINDENPLEKAARHAAESNFQVEGEGGGLPVCALGVARPTRAPFAATCCCHAGCLNPAITATQPAPYPPLHPTPPRPWCLLQTPIDEVDAAARVVDPILSGVVDPGCRSFGVFLKVRRAPATPLIVSERLGLCALAALSAVVVAAAARAGCVPECAPPCLVVCNVCRQDYFASEW